MTLILFEILTVQASTEVDPEPLPVKRQFDAVLALTTVTTTPTALTIMETISAKGLTFILLQVFLCYPEHSQCFDGFYGDGSKGGCFDEDECLRATHDCDPNADCKNYAGLVIFTSKFKNLKVPMPATVKLGLLGMVGTAPMRMSVAMAIITAKKVKNARIVSALIIVDVLRFVFYLIPKAEIFR